jgi:nucleotide-binding universal stress UspA family protein
MQEGQMQLNRIVIATDESQAGRQAVRAGRELARRTSARIFVMRVVSHRALVTAGQPSGGPLEEESDQSEHERLRRWLDAELSLAGIPGEAELGIAAGVPSIEISRFAENYRADLLVLGRKARSQAARILVGDTADAVARRSRVPCLFIPSGAESVRRILVALDGSERGMVVLQRACGFARGTGAALRVLTVEPAVPGKDGAALEPPLARSQRLASRVRQIVRRELGEQAHVTLENRRGEPVAELLRAVEDPGTEVLAIGFNRGGPPGVLEAGSTARRLAHLAPCAVLTIPL